MIREINIYGMFVPPMLVWSLIALVVAAVLRRAISWLGLYRFIWHKPLFDLSLLVIVLGGVVAIALRGTTP